MSSNFYFCSFNLWPILFLLPSYLDKKNMAFLKCKISWTTVAKIAMYFFQVAMMLIIIVAVFVVCHSIRSIVNIYETIQYIIHGELKGWPDWIQTLVHISHFSLVFNSSINILIYSCKDEKFFNVMLVTLGLSR